MIELLNFYYLICIPSIILIAYAVFMRLREPSEYRNISSRLPSLTNGFWSEVKLALSLAMKNPKDLLPFYMDAIKTKGPIVHFSLAGRSYVVLNDPDDIKITLTSAQHITKGPEYDMLKPWLNEGLLLSSGSKWQKRRKLLTNTFHFKNLHMYNPSTNKHSRILAKKLMEASANNKAINIKEYVTLCSLDIICETIMGINMHAQEGESVQYVRSIESACKSVIDRVYKFWLWNEVIYRLDKSGRTFYKSIKILHDYTDKVIKSKRTLINNSKNQNIQPEIENEKKQRKSFLDLLLDIVDENPDEITDQDIREEVDTFLFEGHDTSSIAMTMTLILLGLYQDIQDKVRDELYDIFGDSDRDATIEDLNSMKYLEAVIKESLRLYPSVPAFTRELQTTLQLNNYSIPPMTTITIMPYILHRTEELYPNPEEFIPERFLDEANKSKFLFGYLPFSAGARNCIGQKYAMYQLKTIVSSVLRKMKIETMGSKDDIQISMQLVIRMDLLPKVKFHKI